MCTTTDMYLYLEHKTFNYCATFSLWLSLLTVQNVFIGRLKREREERRLQQSANPRGTITLSVNATDMFMKYYDEYEIL